MADTAPAPIVLDPLARDVHGEAAALRAAGPVAPVELPDGVRAWAITRHELGRRLLTDRRLSRDPAHWGALRRGEVPEAWPLIGLVVTPPNLVSAEGADHRRLRTPVSRAFTARRVEALRPRIAEITAGLLDGLAALSDGEPVDLKPHFAFPLPMSVISELFGVPADRHAHLRTLYGSLFDATAAPEEVPATLAALDVFFDELIAEKRAEPGDDLTSALLAAPPDEERLTADEVKATLQVMVAAGHETTVNLLVNTVRALLGQPAQLAAVRSGEVPWRAAVEESLRWDAPTTNVLFRYAVEELEIAGVRIAEGDAVMVSYGAFGRDPQRFGDDADLFDVRRADQRHLSFGHGPHACPGAPLARLEAEVALPALFDRFPELELAVADGELAHNPSFFVNSLAALPVRLGQAAPPSSGSSAAMRLRTRRICSP